MNTNEKISNAMNIKSEVQTENVYIPKTRLIDSAVELNEKIEKLKKSIEHQKDTLINWREEDNVLQSATQYRDEMIEDVIKLEHLKRSFCLVCDEMIRKI
jgi:hypothetical protein